MRGYLNEAFRVYDLMSDLGRVRAVLVKAFESLLDVVVTMNDSV